MPPINKTPEQLREERVDKLLMRQMSAFKPVKMKVVNGVEMVHTEFQRAVFEGMLLWEAVGYIDFNSRELCEFIKAEDHDSVLNVMKNLIKQGYLENTARGRWRLVEQNKFDGLYPDVPDNAKATRIARGEDGYTVEETNRTLVRNFMMRQGGYASRKDFKKDKILHDLATEHGGAMLTTALATDPSIVRVKDGLYRFGRNTFVQMPLEGYWLNTVAEQWAYKKRGFQPIARDDNEAGVLAGVNTPEEFGVVVAKQQAIHIGEMAFLARRYGNKSELEVASIIEKAVTKNFKDVDPNRVFRVGNVTPASYWDADGGETMLERTQRWYVDFENGYFPAHVFARLGVYEGLEKALDCDAVALSRGVIDRRLYVEEQENTVASLHLVETKRAGGARAKEYQKRYRDKKAAAKLGLVL